MKKYLKGISRLSGFALFVVIIISILCSYEVLNQPISSYLNSKLPMCQLTIQVLEEVNKDAVPNHEVWLENMQIGNNKNLQELYSSNINGQGFELRLAKDYGYNSDVIVCTGGAASELKIWWPIGQQVLCKFWKQSYSGIIYIKAELENKIIDQKTVDLYADQENQYYDYTAPKIRDSRLVRNQIIRIGIIAFTSVILFGVITHFLYKKLILKYEHDDDNEK